MAYDFKDKKDFDEFHSWTLKKATRANDGFNLIEFYERFGRITIDSTETENYDFGVFHRRLMTLILAVVQSTKFAASTRGVYGD